MDETASSTTQKGEPVHAAGMLPGSESIHGQSSNQVVFLIAGIVLVAVFLIAAVFSVFKIPFSLAWVLPCIFLVFVAGIWFVVKQSHTPWKWNRNGSFSDPSFRLRITGEGAATEAVLNDIHTDSFEPVVLRSLGGVTLAKALPLPPTIDATGLISKDFHAWQFEAQPTFTFQHLVVALIYVVFFGTLFSRAFGGWSGISIPHILGAIGVAAVLRALARPEYVRISPGVLDIFRYRFLGMGKPKMERFDLRTATIVIDLGAGAARIHDLSRPQFPVLYLSLRSLLAKPRTTATALLSGARSIGETPPLPTDALVG